MKSQQTTKKKTLDWKIVLLGALVIFFIFGFVVYATTNNETKDKEPEPEPTPSEEENTPSETIVKDIFSFLFVIVMGTIMVLVPILRMVSRAGI